ncbi:MAG: hydrolase [Ignavibacteriae bacterium HGW-Ignavibacteriae-2]|jgi:3'-5' exoribonuclease|nr:MAG: hydrolase [Ignavibacteriae bacterium HGW-Ignavibacteriae-2]
MQTQSKLNKVLVGDSLNHFLLLSKREIRTAKNGRDYLNIELRDDTNSLSSKMWDGFAEIFTTAKEGDIVKVEGVIDEFQGTPQIKINKIRKVDPADGITFEYFLPKSERNLDLMKKELGIVIDSISNPFIKQLLGNVLVGERFDKYLRVPAGKSWHHSYIHGLLEHTLEIVKICELAASFHNEVKRDLLIAGAILHDFGKTEELKIDANFDYTDKGRLIGHIVIAANIVDKECEKISEFPEDLKYQLIHLILSHQGKLEFASPVEPKTLEAIILYHADELSAKANAYKNAIKSENSSSSNWTKYLPLANTALYIPRDKENDVKENLFDL